MAIALTNAYTSPQSPENVHKRNKGGNGNEKLRPEGKQSLEKSAAETGADRGDGHEQEFFWTYTEEPHRTRRQAIIKAHPEVCKEPSIPCLVSMTLTELILIFCWQVTKLCGPEPLTKYTVAVVVGLQILCAWLLRNTPVISWPFLVTAYAVGATANQNLFLAIHEISHNLAFKSPMANRLLAIFANLPIGIPYSASFRVSSSASVPFFKEMLGASIRADRQPIQKPYHLTHHKSLGVDGLDTDLPTALEATLLDSVLGKAFFCTFQILFYALRPMMVYQLPITRIHILNIVVQLLFDAALVHLAGVRALAYLILSSFLAGSLHPCAAHFIAEHYVLDGPHEQPASSSLPLPETFSYYGPLNLLTYNVGLHNEHHDFPAVPWTRLPRLHAIAKDFYRDTPRHESWVYVFWLFIRDERVGLWCRVKRVKGGRKVGGGGGGGGGATATAGKSKSDSNDGWREDELGANEVKGAHIPGVL